MKEKPSPASPGSTEAPAPVPSERSGAEYLANERTFLAWIRTSIALLTLGFLLSRVTVSVKVAPPGAPGAGHRLSFAPAAAAQAMIALGAVVAILAAWRYHVVNLQIERGTVRADLWLVVLVTVLVIALAAALVFVPV